MHASQTHSPQFPVSSLESLREPNPATSIAHILVQTPAPLAEIAQPLFQAKVLAADTETTSLAPFLGKIRLIQLAIAHHPAVVVNLFASTRQTVNPSGKH